MEAIEELLHGIGPLRPSPDKLHSFVGCLAEALWYVGDGRPYQELIAATSAAFSFGASAAVPCPGQWLERCPDLTLQTASRAAGTFLTYHETAADCAESDPAWQPARELLAASLRDRRPVLARGGWSSAAEPDWGVITGRVPDGLPAGHRWTAGGPAIEALTRPPAQLIFFEKELARPGARDLTVEILDNAIACLRGELTGHVALGQPWSFGPDALALWADRLDQEPFCAGCEASGCQQRLEAHYRAARRWAGRFLSDTAALRLGRVRPAREIGREFAALAERHYPDGASVRAAGAQELHLADGLETLLA